MIKVKPERKSALLDDEQTFDVLRKLLTSSSSAPFFTPAAGCDQTRRLAGRFICFAPSGWDSVTCLGEAAFLGWMEGLGSTFSPA